MKICQVRTELFHADGRTAGQTDKHDEANSCFRNVANKPKKNTLCGSGRVLPSVRPWPETKPFVGCSLNCVLD
jgi:hypothetical protein